MANRVDIKIGYSIDKNGLNELHKILDDISVQAKMPGKEMNQGLQNAAKTARQLSNIIDKSFNKDLGTINVARFNQELSKTHLDMVTIKRDLENVSQGSSAFNILSSSILSANAQIKTANKALDQMAVTLKNTIRYGISSSIFNNFANSFQKAYDYAKNLDKSLNDIRIVTDASAEKMEQFAISANKASKQLGTSTLDYTKAALVYYQQGLSDEEARARAEITLKAANVTGQSADEVSELLTAVWNGYKVNADEAELYIDKLAAVAATTAADLEELSVGMSKVASAANLMGVDIDQLNAQLATIVSVTRQAPESVGTALKTIYARMSNIQAGLDEETTLGNYTEKMAQMGVNVLDMNGKLRDMGEVIEEIGNKWTHLSREQQVSLSQTMAGTRQYNNLLALFDNWDMYTDAIKTSQEAVGTLQHQQDIYIQSTEAHLNRLKATWEDLYDSAIDTSEVNAGIDLLNNLIQTFDNFIDSFGGGVKSLTALGAVLSNVFNKQISSAITNFVQNQTKMQQNIDLLEKKRQAIQIGASETGITTSADQAELANTSTQLKYAQQIREVEIGISQEQYNQLTNLQAQMGELEKKAVLLEKESEENTKKVLGEEEYQKYLQAELKTEEDIATYWQKGIDSAEEELNIRQKSLAYLEKQSKYAEHYVLDEREIADIQEEIDGLIGRTNGELEKELKKATKNIDFNKATLKEKEKILNIVRKIVQEQENEVNATKKNAEAVEQERINKEEAARLRQQEGQLNVEFENTMNYVKQATDIAERVTMVTSSLSAMATSWNYINSLFQTWNDENASLSDKITQSIMTMSFTIPLLVKAFTSLKNVADLYNISQAKDIALKEVQKKLTADEIAGLTTKQIIERALKITKAQGIEMSEKEITTRLTNIGLIKKETEAKVTETAITTSMTKAQKALNASMLAFPGTWVVIALAAVAGIISAVTSNIEKNNEVAKEANNQAIETEKAKQKEIDTNQDLLKSYNDLYEQYKQGQIAKDELEKATRNLKDAYADEHGEIVTLIDDYDTLNAKVIEWRKQEAERGKISAETERSRAKANLDLAFQGKLGDSWQENLKYPFDKLAISEGFDPTDELKAEAVLKEIFGNQFFVNTNENWLTGAGDVTIDSNDAVDLYNKLVQASQKIQEIPDYDESKSEVYTGINKAIKKLEEFVNAYTEADEKVAKYDLQIRGLTADFTTKSMATFRKEREAFIDYVATLYEGESPDKIANIADQYIKQISGNAKQMLEKAELADAIAKNFSGENKQKIDNALEQLTYDETQILSGLFRDNVITIDENTSLEQLQQYIKRAQDIVKYNQANMLATYANDIYTALSQDKILTADQQKEVEKLEAKYIELGQILDKNSNEYLDKLIQIREQEEENATIVKQAIEAQLIDEAVKIDVEADTSNFDDALNKIAQADYEVLVTVQADIQSDFDSLTSTLDNIESMASKIGDDFIVAAQDIEELNNAFPGILTNMTLLDDGTAQLNENAVQNAMATAQEEVRLSTEATVEKLKNQQKEMESKQEAAQTIATIAHQISKGEKSQADVQGEINEALNKLKEENTETEGKFEKDTQKDIAETAKINATSMQNSFAQAYQKMSQDSAKWAESAKHNLMVGATGIGNPTTASINTKWSATSNAGTISTADKGELTSEIDASTQADWAKVEEYYQNLADSYGNAANNIQGKIGEILARNNKLNKVAANIVRGLGPDGKSNKSGGGGSGSSKPPGEDDFDKELNRYHDIDIELTNISTSMKRLEDEQKKLFGKDLIANINKEMAFLDKQVETTTRKIGMMEEELAELRDKYSDKYGFAFDNEGYISNYNDIIGAEIKAVAELSELYNHSTAEEQEVMQNTLDKRKKYVDELIKAAENYDNKRVKDYEGLIDDRQKALDEQITKAIQKFDMEIEIRLDLAEAERDWNEFKKTIIDEVKDDDILGQAIGKLTDFSSYYKEDSTGIVQSLTKQVKDTLNELDKMDKLGESDVYGNNRTAALEDLEKYYKSLMSNLTDVAELQKKIHEAYIDMQDEVQKKFDKQVETYEMIGDLIDHDMKVIQLVYGDKSYSALGKYYERQEENNNKQLDFHRQQVDFWKKQMDSAEKGSKAWDNAREKWEDAVKNWKDLIIDSIEDLQDKYLNTINEIFDNLNNKVTDGLGLDYVNEQWTLINKNAEQYLDNINSLYSIQELENKYLQAIDKTDSVGAQRQLKELMDAELADLRERDKLTQYDIDRANKKYEIALKQIALQEAQQNKTKMRLRRDSQGNYRYEYVNDNDQVNQIQDELNGLYNSLYNFDKARYQENLGQIYSAWNEFQKKMAEAAQINDPQKQAERKLLLEEQYGELINGLVEQNTQIRTNLQDSAFEDLARLYDKDIEEFQRMSDTEVDTLMNSLVPQWESGVQKMADAFADDEDGFMGVCRKALNKLNDATKDYQNSLDDLQTEAGEDFNDIYNDIDETIDITEDLLDVNDDLIDIYDQELGKMGELITKLDGLIAKYSAARDAAIEAAKAAHEYWSDASDEAADNAGADNIESIATSVLDTNPLLDTAENTGADLTKSDINANMGDGILKVGDTATLSGSYYQDSFGGGKSGSYYSGIANGVIVDSTSSTKYGGQVSDKYTGDYDVHIMSADGRYKDLGWVKKSQLSGYDTGGYTGAWGNDGRLALLHQKELVLNAHDTENMLNAVTIMRDITSTLGGSILKRLAGIAAAGINGTANDGVLDQNVNIQATFPNVTSSREIEDALNNLVNMAAIRANRKGS